jgi:uncharacterized membrane protein
MLKGKDKMRRKARFFFYGLIISMGFLFTLPGCAAKEKLSGAPPDGGGNRQGAIPAAVLSDPVPVVDQDLVIPIGDISPTARFYPVQIEGTLLEVLAVQAPDGTIRTAFNTCQVCYSSGRGYYKQQGNVLVCQNCGNRFRMGQVEIASGGCNPVPIFPQYKRVDENTITIPREFLAQARLIFARWKGAS